MSPGRGTSPIQSCLGHSKPGSVRPLRLARRGAPWTAGQDGGRASGSPSRLKVAAQLVGVTNAEFGAVFGDTRRQSSGPCGWPVGVGQAGGHRLVLILCEEDVVE